MTNIIFIILTCSYTLWVKILWPPFDLFVIVIIPPYFIFVLERLSTSQALKAHMSGRLNNYWITRVKFIHQVRW